jgi:hypothetical protein
MKVSGCFREKTHCRYMHRCIEHAPHHVQNAQAGALLLNLNFPMQIVGQSGPGRSHADSRDHLPG